MKSEAEEERVSSAKTTVKQKCGGVEIGVDHISRSFRSASLFPSIDATLKNIASLSHWLSNLTET